MGRGGDIGARSLGIGWVGRERRREEEEEGERERKENLVKLSEGNCCIHQLFIHAV